MDLIQKAIEKGLIKFNIDKTRITYIKQNFETDFGEHNPEETVRLNTYLELIEDYGYKPENIKFEIKVKLGSNYKFADIVVFHNKSKKAFVVIETKKEDTTDKITEIYKQARSYAYSDELMTSTYFAYRIGANPIVLYEKPDDKSKAKLPYDYDSKIVYAYLVENEPVPPPPPHYQTLKSSTPYDLKMIFKTCHDIVWNRGEKNAQDAFDEFSKLLFLKMFDELECEEQHLKQYFFQTKDYETAEELYKRITKEYKRAVADRKVEKILTPLNITEFQLQEIVSKLQQFSLIETDNDPKGLAFETFIKHYMKGEFGQFFTPRNIVEFMLKVSPIVWDDTFSKENKVLDPCCGSGSFLVHSIGQFKKRYKKARYWQYFANNGIYGVELNDKISVTAKINIALHDDGHDNIKNIDGLNTTKVWEQGKFDLILTNPPFGSNVPNRKKPTNLQTENLKQFYDYEKFDLTAKLPDRIDVLTGRAKDPDSLQGEKYMYRKYGKQISSEIIFFELYYKTLREKGIAEIVIPDGLLTNSSSQDVRDWIQDHFRVLAVVSLPQYAFSHYGAGVKSSIIFLQKHEYKTTQKIKTAKLKHLEIALTEKRKELEKLYTELKELPNKYTELQNVLKKQDTELENIQKLYSDNKKHNETHTKQIIDFYKAEIKKIKASNEYKQWLRESKADINEQIKVLKEIIYELADNNFQQFEKEYDYQIFMAIADTIGYDATGRDTTKNDLDKIAEELKRFLIHIRKYPNVLFQ